MMGNEEVGCGRHGGHGICGVCVGERLMKLQGFSSSSAAAAAAIRSPTTSYVGSVGTIASLISIDIMQQQQQQQGSVANAAQLRRSHSVCEVSHRTHSLKSLLLAEKLTDIHHSPIVAAASHYNLNHLRQNPSVQAAPSTLETAAKQSRSKNFQIFGQRSANRLTEGSHAKRSKFRSRWGFLMGRQGSEIVSVAPHNYVVRPISIDEKPALTRSQSQGVAWSKSLFRSPMSFFRSSSLR